MALCMSLLVIFPPVGGVPSWAFISMEVERGACAAPSSAAAS